MFKKSKGLDIESQVGIVMGSDSDLEVMKESAKVLERFGVGYEMRILSAHRSGELLREYLRKSKVEVYIAGAGVSAHLAGVIASQVLVPVIGVPLGGGHLEGLDSLYSTVQMPGGIAVGTMGIGVMGAKNAGLYAVQILSVKEGKKGRLGLELEEYRRLMLEGVRRKDEELREKGWEGYLSDIFGRGSGGGRR